MILQWSSVYSGVSGSTLYARTPGGELEYQADTFLSGWRLRIRYRGRIIDILERQTLEEVEEVAEAYGQAAGIIMEAEEA